MSRTLSFDIDSFNRAFVGFDPLFNIMQREFDNTKQPSYPPYNIVKLSDDQFEIEIAVAGFSKDDLSIETVPGELTVTGKKEKVEKNYVHRGLSGRSFVRKFQLSEYIEVTFANLENGILKLGLARQIPEEKKPRKVDII